MPTSKLKNCVLVLLLLTNLALGLLVVLPGLTGETAEPDSRAAVAAIYADHGIDLDAEQIPESASAGTLVCSGSAPAEQGGLYTLDSGLLFAPDGTQVSDAFTVQESGSTNTATVMVTFLNAVLDSGDVVSRVDSIETGYTITTVRSRSYTLRSVWRFSTDTADYELNLVTGSCVKTTN